MSDNQRPKTGGKMGDRQNKSNRDTHPGNRGGKSDKLGKKSKGIPTKI